MSEEMPNVPRVSGCVCYPEEMGNITCVCGLTEKALRVWARGTLLSMTKEQREWCLTEIDSVEGYRRSDYETASDSLLANGVLSAWVDYARDKGLL